MGGGVRFGQKCKATKQVRKAQNMVYENDQYVNLGLDAPNSNSN
jgi:hypothetical protein